MILLNLTQPHTASVLGRSVLPSSAFPAMTPSFSAMCRQEKWHFPSFLAALMTEWNR
jgi:hypothetical protein